MKTPTVTFKTKVRKLVEPDGSKSDYVDVKRRVHRRDCNLKPHEHAYYNSDLFEPMLNGAYRRIIGTREWIRLTQLPPGVSVDTSRFLATVTVTLPSNFK